MSKEKTQLTIGRYVISVLNEEADQQTIDEVFSGCYDFKTEKKTPYIIDAGSNIGVSTIFFKERYPHSSIVCFEPDANVYLLLKQNIERNKITGVSIVNAALSDKAGDVLLYGQMLEANPDTRGNSLVKTWGAKRSDSSSMLVKAVPLASYLDREVDFLKLDIEGAEQRVLEAAKEKLHFVNEACIEVHITDEMKEINSLDKIKDILVETGFDVTITKSDEGVLPETIKDWVLKYRPELYMVRATRQRKGAENG